MKLFSVFFGFILCLSALSAAEFRLGVVDFQRALNSVEEGKSAKAKLQKEFEAKQKDMDARKEKLEKLRAELEDLQNKMRSNLLNEAEQKRGRKVEEDFQKQLREWTELAQKHQKEIAEKETGATQEILRKLRAVMDDLGRSGNFTMVLEKNESGLVYASEVTDLTEKLIQKYNSLYKGGDAKK